MLAEATEGEWVRAHHMTDWGVFEIRLRRDGDFDVRVIGEGGAPCDRAVSGAYVRAEYCTDLSCGAAPPKRGQPLRPKGGG